MAEGYCFKCKKKVVLNAPKSVILKNERKAVSGTCPVCNAKVYTFGRTANDVRNTDQTKK
jgi:RNase P subunit RPR2